MPVDTADLTPVTQQAVNDHPALWGNVEWLRKTCDDPDPNADDELLRVLLALIEDALQGALPLLGAHDRSPLVRLLPASARWHGLPLFGLRGSQSRLQSTPTAHQHRHGTKRPRELRPPQQKPHLHQPPPK